VEPLAECPAEPSLEITTSLVPRYHDHLPTILPQERPESLALREMRLLFRVSGLSSCQRKVDKRYHEQGRHFPVAARRMGQFKGTSQSRLRSDGSTFKLMYVLCCSAGVR
jgi:hypothetical protein